MQNKGYILIWIFLIGFLSGCTSLQQKKDAQLSAGLYGAQAAIKAGRFDIASKLINSTAKLETPPKKVLAINSFSVVNENADLNPKININSTGIFTKDQVVPPTQYVVLPEGMQTSNVIAAQDSTYNKLIQENKPLAKTEEANTKTIDSFTKKTDQVVKDIAYAAAHPKKGFFAKIFGFFHFLGLGSFIIGILIIIGLIVACIFFPPLIPIAEGIFSGILHGFNWVLGLIAGLFKKKT